VSGRVAGALHLAEAPVSLPPLIPAEGQLSGEAAFLNRTAVEVFLSSSVTEEPTFRGFREVERSGHPAVR
jgi:hypothetical protein